MRVFVYFNLHRKCWSIKALEGERKGRVIGHAHYIDLADVTWKVSEAGRQRVLREKKKNVHAGAVGVLEKWSEWDGATHGVAFGDTTFDRLSLTNPDTAPDTITYNPYKGPTFYEKYSLVPMKRSAAAYFTASRNIFAYGSN